MADFKILCPACTSILSSKKPIANGKKITCPHCHKPFVAATSFSPSSADSGSSLDLEFNLPAPPAPEPAASRAQAKSGAASSSRGLTKVSPQAHATPKSRRVLMWTLILLLVVLAAGGGAAGMYFFMLPPETPIAEKGKGKKAAEPSADGKAPVAQNKPKNEPRKDDKAGKASEKPAVPPKEENKQPPGADKGEAPKPAVVPVPPPAAKPQVADWKEFKSTKGGYSVDLPVKPEEFLERDEDIIFYETRSELNGFEYEISFHRLKKDDLSTPAMERLNKIAEEYKGSIITKKEIEFEKIPKVPVLELTMFKNDKKDVAVERWLVYKEHVFHIGVIGDKEKLGPDQVSRYMQSFRFVADPQGEFLDLTKTTGIPPERKKK